MQKVLANTGVHQMPSATGIVHLTIDGGKMKKRRIKKPLLPSNEWFDLPPCNRVYLKHEIKYLQVFYYHNYDGSITMELRLR